MTIRPGETRYDATEHFSIYLFDLMSGSLKYEAEQSLHRSAPSREPFNKHART